MSSEVTINIKTTSADKHSVTISAVATVEELKNKIAESMNISNQMRLIHRGRVLKDEFTLEHYEIVDGQTVHMVKGSNPSSAPSSSATNVSSNNTNIPPATSVPTNTNNLSTNPLMNPMSNPMMGMGGNFAQMQQQMMQNPAMMEQMMNNPMVESLLNNPDVLRNMIQSNPQMQQLFDANPQMRHIMNDPAVLAVYYT